jgi:hypothetical protein
MAKNNGKYELLKKYLRAQTAQRLPVGFSDIEKIVGERLPKSAKMYRTWWSNDASHHVQASAWLDAGYRTEQVDMEGCTLVFARVGGPRGMAEARHEFVSVGGKMERHPMIGALKGTFTIEPGWDLNKPALDAEELEAMEANLDRTADLIARGLGDKQP